ncbi:hypothetical protein Tco_0541262 [Tanacetum coccineum]
MNTVVHPYTRKTENLEVVAFMRGACVFTDKWSLDELAYGVPTDGGGAKSLERIRVREESHSTSSLPPVKPPSFSHLNDDDDDDGNGEGTSRASTPSPIRYVNSLTNQVPQVFQNPPNIDPHLEPFYTRQTEIINRQVQIRDEQRGGLRSIGKGLKNLWRNIKK